MKSSAAIIIGLGMTLEFVFGVGLISHPASVFQEMEGLIMLGFGLLTFAVSAASGRIAEAVGRRSDT